ncbi:hypothetical protein Gotur_006349, partial [Gossypium turneri]
MPKISRNLSVFGHLSSEVAPSAVLDGDIYGTIPALVLAIGVDLDLFAGASGVVEQVELVPKQLAHNQTGVWFAVKGLQPKSVIGLLPSLPVIGITPPQRRL